MPMFRRLFHEYLLDSSGPRQRVWRTTYEDEPWEVEKVRVGHRLCLTIWSPARWTVGRVWLVHGGEQWLSGPTPDVPSPNIRGRGPAICVFPSPPTDSHWESLEWKSRALLSQILKVLPAELCRDRINELESLAHSSRPPSCDLLLRFATLLVLEKLRVYILST